MSYGLKYETQFTSQSDANIPEKDYKLQFLFKGYTGEAVSIVGAETSVVQRCVNDSPTDPIKGQVLDINIINKSGSLPITVFQSEDDDGVMVKLFGPGDSLLFIGYLVQDDFYEPMVDFSHPIKLSATDSLGLLKGVILSQAEFRRGYEATFLKFFGFNDVLYFRVADGSFYPTPGSTLEIQGTSYTITSSQYLLTTISGVTYNYIIKIAPDPPAYTTPVTDTVYLTAPLDLLNKNSLLLLIASCLYQTNLTLQTYIFHNLYEVNQDSSISTFEQTLIDSQVFISGDTYDNCYDVLNKILTAFNCTIFQANGVWNIVNFYEAKRYSNAIPCFIYDELWKRAGTGTLNNIFNIGPDPQLTRPIYQLTRGAIRGWKFDKKTFKYNQNKYLLRNYDLQTLGPLIRQYVSGATTVYEYTATGWTAGLGPVLSERFIRVIHDASANEIDRYLVTRGASSDTIRDVASDAFELNAGDKIIFSFSTRTNFSLPPTFGGVFAVKLTDGTSVKYIDDVPAGNGAWINTVGFNYSFTSNLDQWTNVEIASSQTPISGLCTCYLAQNHPAPFNSSRETHYKDIRLEYTPYIYDSTKVIGHVHTQTQDVNKKLNNDATITIDDSPRNSIAGTLFLTSKVGLLQKRTEGWLYPGMVLTAYKLGQLTTLQELLWKQTTRSKLEGGFIGNYQTSVISLLTMAITDFDPTKSYAFGLLTIDYKKNQFSGTLWEIYDTNDPELINEYLFTYLYSTT